MSLLVRLKNKLQDPIVHEIKLREFDECMTLLKNENVELHKRLDQLEASYQTNLSTQQTHFLQEHIRELEQENGRLFTENQCQREEYERFLDQLTTMVIQTASMQENIRKECALIYHVIERLASLRTNSLSINSTSDVIKEAQKRSLNTSFNINNQLIHSSSSSSSSLTTHCSGSALDLSFKEKDQTQPSATARVSTEEDQPLQRSETFIISIIPAKVSTSSLPVTVNDHLVQQQPITPPMVITTSTPVRPSRLPSRCANTKTQASNTTNNNRSLSTQKVSKVPVRTTTSLNRQPISTKTSNIPTPIAKSKKDVPNIVLNRTNSSANHSTPKKPIRPLPVIQLASTTTQSHTITITEKTDNPSPLTKCPRTRIEIIKSDDLIEPNNSTSSESSIEEVEHLHQLLPLVQDEGYSTWSSVDVKDDGMKITTEKNEIDQRQKNIGLVKTWLDTSNRRCSTKPVKEVEPEALTPDFFDSPLFLCPFVRNRCSQKRTNSLPSTTNSLNHKEISLDSLDSQQSKEQTITSSSSSSSSSSSTFSRSETFDKLLIKQTLSNITDDLTDSTSSTSSTFNMSEYIEDHFLEHDDHSSVNSSSFETTIITKNLSFQPEKRLLFPGLLNRLIFFRRVLSDSDLQRREFSMTENENPFHVYHSNIINEHSVEVNLINTYGSESELHVWSHDCAEQRRFLNERQQQLEDNQSNSNQQLAVERQMLLQQIYEYPWLLQENDLDQTTIFPPANIQQTSDLMVPSPNPTFYQLCALTNSSSFVISHDSHA